MRHVQQRHEKDCLSACLSAVLDIPLAAVPFFDPDKLPGSKQLDAVNDWLSNFNLCIVEVPFNRKSRTWPWCGNPRTMTICTVLTGESTRHSVVGLIENGKLSVAFDPAPPGHRVTKYQYTHIGFIVPTVAPGEDWENLRLLK